MSDIKDLKDYFEALCSLADKYDPDFRKHISNDLLMFCLYIMAADSKLTEQEIQFFAELTGKLYKPEGILMLMQSTDWSEYGTTIPGFLNFTIALDQESGSEFDDSITKEFLGNLILLGEALARVDGEDKSEMDRVRSYMMFLFEEAIGRISGDEGKTKKGKSSQSGHAKPKAQAKSQSVAKQDTSQSQSGPKDGNWIPMQEHIPTGNFLDDVFRDKRLTHEDRVKIWEQLIGDSLPCINITDLQFKQPAWFGVDCADISINKIYDTGSTKTNKPIYYYASGIASTSLESGEMLVPAGLLIMHGGIVIVQESGGQMIGWDNIREIHDDGEDGMYVFSALSSDVDFGGVEANKFKINLVQMDIVERTLDCVGENDYYEFYFPKKSFLKGITVPTHNELTALIKLINRRIEQIEPDRGSPSLTENPAWYTGLNYEETHIGDTVKKYNVITLCEDYLQNKGTKPGKTDKSQPPKPDKPAKQAEKKAEAPKPKPAAPQPAKKASGAVSIPTTGPTTKLDFWQAFKPYIDQMRHTEFSKVKIKDDDCLDAKPTVIVGVYNSILMRVSKNILRLELYIDTETEAGNLQILDYIKAKIKVPPALKGKIEYERKEGRRAQRVCVSFPGFELTNRSCWGKYISELMSVADDFFDAVEAPMRELISGS